MAPTLVQSFFASLLLASVTLADRSALAHQRLHKRVALVTPANLPTGWASQGCYTEGNGVRALLSASTSGSTMTDESCINFCNGNGYSYAGTEYADECYCGNYLAGGSTTAATTDCNMACAGNSTEACGGPNRLNVFLNTVAPVQYAPIHDPGPPGWASIGCYTDSVGARTLSYFAAPVGGASGMTIRTCTAACKAAGYTYAAAEYASQCYCDNAFNNNGGPASDGFTGCNMLCNGNSSEYCGGPNRLEMFQAVTITSVTSTPTTSSSTTTTKPTTTTTVIPTTTSTTTTSTSSTTTSKPTTSTTSTTTSKPTTSTTSTTTSKSTTSTTTTATSTSTTPTTTSTTTTSTTSTTTSKSTTSTSSTTTSTTTTSTTPTSTSTSTTSTTSTTTSTTKSSTTTTSSTTITTSTTSTTTTPKFTSAATALPAGWSYQGCWVDNLNGRILINQQNDNAALTDESCVSTCIGLGYSVAGMEYGVQCFCGNAIIQGGALANSDTECNMACGGSSAEMCGAGNRMSIYSNGPLTVLQPAAVQKTGLPGSWTYQGCITENTTSRVLPNQIIMPTNNTATTCLNICAQFGFGAAGLEYGEECYCGDSYDLAIGGSTFVPDSQCNVLCSGSDQYLCGGGNLLSYYIWTGPNLNTWSYPQGNAAGSYQQLIGGVVVPLITTPGVNGKYTFVEKFGTGAPNSTGAYELDLSQINNFAAAWRPMHVKTDVFCSAGLTLPDKVGRQINIGGWSGTSTFGVRLYWPDGSPGVAGVNDWQENENEVALQTGRWYPSAVIMANGSVLVVGGENGSNGPPVPNLEILPPTGGGLVSCPFLAQTDPFSLYPFLAVLPTGGIFIAYYNQAQILDEVTLLTKQMLPGIPSGVGHPEGGRTYPLEGTAVIMPLSAPYTTPLTVMICGGSTPGPAIAIDNCVSMQPEVAGSQWVIERMPSQRVMTCMTALPDGTFLILNGAHQGTAGFGLATSPNLNAVLYDPSKPVNSRFSVMANTTVARLYHSEAILMQDGRVMVSGSDPQDGIHPEEYRVEVFSPPYALSGLTPPTFTITNKDWSYGQAVQIVVSLKQGTTSTMKVSLMGAESSTHGNSMGQRTLFPAFTCAGNTCTVTAPPNSHVCPPGWFQMFVLDGPTPSFSTWVRIGGDPAAVGNWPNFPDFTIPGV